MKHVKRKFLYESSSFENHPSKNNLEILDFKDGKAEGYTEKDVQQKLKKFKGILWIEGEAPDGSVACFVNNFDGHYAPVPVLDPTIVYINSAQLNLRNLLEMKEAMVEGFQNLNLKDHNFFNFYGTASGFIIMSFTAIESLLNSLIKEDDIYEYDDNGRRTIRLNREQIFRYISFNDKLKEVVPKLTGKDFMKKHKTKAQLIENLKGFRDEIIHTKPDGTDPLQFSKMMKKYIKYDYSKAFEAVVELINYYKNDYIVECNCGADF